MLPVLISLALLLASSALAVIFSNKPARAQAAGALGAASASLIGLFPAVKTLIYGGAQSLSLPWPVPLGSFSLLLDPLAAVFLLPVFLLTGAAAVYGAGYLRRLEGVRPVGLAWAAFNLLSASMALVIVSANAVLFMTAWELMAVSSFLLVLFDHERAQARRAGFIYLVTGAAGALALLCAFSLLSTSGGALDFAGFSRPQGLAASAVFALALCGFGLKAGFIPLHVWLPEAHPAAPSHVSAVMSGVMIKLGIYGLLRTLGFLLPWPAWWGGLVLVLGAVSGLGGVLFALAQHDLKRLLAYHSVENIGIILMGLGLGMLGFSYGYYTLAAFAFSGAILHVVNHALFKGLLFMSAGSVIRATGTGELEALGGLAKKMPRTAFYFLLGSAAISGLPPLNGFISEFLIYMGAFQALVSSSRAAPWGVAVILSLAAIGALAAACFCKAFGSVFLGEARSSKCEAAREAGPLLLSGMFAPAAACAVIGLGPLLLVRPLTAVLGSVFDGRLAFAFSSSARLPLVYVTAAAAALAALLALAAAARKYFLGGKTPAAGPTWDCGYARPTPRMQYGASSFVQSITDLFQPVLRVAGRYPVISVYFPGKASFSTEAQALVYNTLYTPVARRIRELAYRFSWIQHGRLQIYIMYIVMTLIGLLLWKL